MLGIAVGRRKSLKNSCFILTDNQQQFPLRYWLTLRHNYPDKRFLPTHGDHFQQDRKATVQLLSTPLGFCDHFPKPHKTTGNTRNKHIQTTLPKGEGPR
ncbi:hypothetical protein AVEN_215939-1 [Araneus ventricosus]|uniref:Uncharacterized protein n=1 Tax=Araneus ventricosus TaxID=182803 RepID=A0A4Y2HHD8_ARAVE|nr:hypothetical protein AVEN_215939-1 [Araneus ventricosus]